MSTHLPLHDMWRPFCPQQYNLPMYISPVLEQPHVCSLITGAEWTLYYVFFGNAVCQDTCLTMFRLSVPGPLKDTRTHKIVGFVCNLSTLS